MSLDLASPNRTLLDSYDRRRYQRYALSFAGRYMLESRREFPCRTIDLSPESAAMRGPVIGRIGERIIAYIDNVGRLEGEITRLFPDGFGMSIHATLRKRDKLATTLAWLAERDPLNADEARRFGRKVPNQPFSTVTLPDGASYRCRMVDLSSTGAALSLAVKPLVGTPITLGRIDGTVVRHLPEGIAVEFLTPQSEDDLSEYF